MPGWRRAAGVAWPPSTQVIPRSASWDVAKIAGSLDQPHDEQSARWQ